jgi:hypothetical protein
VIYAYAKSRREDMTRQQVTVLAEPVKDLKDG